MSVVSVGSGLKRAGIALILVVGLIHLIEGPGYLEEAGTLIGGSFFLNAVGAVVSAVGIARNARSWGWTLGALVAAGAFVAYVLSRTVGLFGFYEEDWLESLGVISLVVEAAYVALFFRVMSSRS